MSVLSDLTIQIGLDDSGVDAGAKDVKEKIGKLGKQIGNMGRNLTAGITMPIVAGFGFAIAQASDLNEAMSAVETTYGEASKGIIEASENSAEAVGLSQAEYLAASTTLGVFGKMAGATGDDLTAFGKDSILAVADLASFYNTPVPEALAAIQSGLMGEYEPLRKYGIMLSEATLQQYALENGLWDGVDAMTEAQKVAARQAFITENMGDATGDFARTSDGLANQMRILKARFKDIAAQFGKILIPYMIKGTAYLKKFADFVEKLSPKQKKWALAFLAVAAAIGPVLIGLSMMIPALALLTGPIGLIIIALAALGTAYALNLWGFRDAVNATAKVLWEIIKPIIAFGVALYDAFNAGKPVSELLTQFPAILQPVIEPILLIADAFGDLVKAFQSGGLKGLLKALPGELKQLTKAWVGLHKALIELLLKGLKAAWPYVLAFIKKIPGWLRDATSAAAAWLIPAGIRVIAGFAQGMRERWVDLKVWFNERRQVIRDVFVDAATILLTKGKNIIQGLWDGAKERWEELKAWVKLIPGAIGEVLMVAVSNAASSLRSRGTSILQKVWDGITTLWDGGAEGGSSLKGWVTGIPGRIAGAISGAVQGAWNTLYNAGYQIFEAVYKGLLNVYNNYIKPLLDKIPWGLIGLGGSSAGLGMGMSTSGYSSGGFSPASGGGNNFYGDINITVPGYNQSPDALATAIARQLGRDIQLTIGATG